MLSSRITSAFRKHVDRLDWNQLNCQVQWNLVKSIDTRQVESENWSTFACLPLTDVKLVSGYVPAPSASSASHDRGSSGNWHSSGHGSAAVKSRDYDQSTGSSSHWSGRGSASVQANSGRADWSSRAPGAASSGTGAGSGTSFLSSATNILMGMGVTGGGSASSSRGTQDPQRFEGYKTISGSSTRRYWLTSQCLTDFCTAAGCSDSNSRQQFKSSSGYRYHTALALIAAFYLNKANARYSSTRGVTCLPVLFELDKERKDLVLGNLRSLVHLNSTVCWGSVFTILLDRWYFLLVDDICVAPSKLFRMYIIMGLAARALHFKLCHSVCMFMINLIEMCFQQNTSLVKAIECLLLFVIVTANIITGLLCPL